MKTKLAYLLKCSIACSVMLIAGACEHKELCFDHSHAVELEIAFDWSEAPEAAPSTMVVQFFTTDGKHYERRELTRNGGKIRIEAGEYKLLFHNGEMKTVDEQGDGYDDYKLSAISQALLDPMGRGDLGNPPRPEETKSEPVHSVPEMVWGGSHTYLNVEAGVSGQSVTLKPAEATAEYTIEVRDVENMTNDLDFSAALSGMAQSWRIADNKLCTTATLSFELDRKNETTLVARFVSFGHCPEQELSHFFSVYTSTKKYYEYDVTEQMHDAQDAKHIRIVINGLKLPEPGSGVNPDMSDWEDVEFDIDMN